MSKVEVENSDGLGTRFEYLENRVREDQMLFGIWTYRETFGFLFENRNGSESQDFKIGFKGPAILRSELDEIPVRS